jgi:hypothetical protein
MRAKFNRRSAEMISLKRLSHLTFAILFALTCATYAWAQQLVKTPRPSQKASVMQTIGVTDITITYSRPGVKGRTIWGDAPPEMAARAKGEATLDNQLERKPGEPIVPWGHVWRAGANEATMFAVTDDVLINGQPLKAGTYSLHTVPGKEEWTVIFNSDPGQWGSFAYDEKKDTLRVKTKAETASESQEWLSYTVEPLNESSARVNLRWERLRVPFTVEVQDIKGKTIAKARATVAAAKPDDWRTPLQAANYALNNKETELGMTWLEQSIKIKETFQNLSAKANYLWTAGRKDEALAVATQAIAKGKADKANTEAFEKRVAGWKSGTN